MRGLRPGPVPESAFRLSRRRLGLLLGGAALAACAENGRDGTGQVMGRRPDRTVALPPPDRQGVLTLAATLADRHSVRTFTRTEVTTAHMSQLLWAAQGVTRDWGGRTAPSAGALYPMDIYAVTAGQVLHYRPAGHRADQWDVGIDLRTVLSHASRSPQPVAAAPLVLVVTGTVRKTSGKYGSRASRFVTLEAGHCAQNVLLQAAALGLGAVPIGAFDDDDVRLALGLPHEQTPYYLIPVGIPDTSL